MLDIWYSPALILALVMSCIAIVLSVLLSKAIGRSKHAELRLRESQQESKALQNRLTLALIAAKSGIFETDLKTGAVKWTGLAAQLFGYLPNQSATHDEVLKRVHPDDLHEVQRAWNQAIREKKDYYTEFRILYPDGTMRWLNAMGRATLNAAGEPISLIGVNQDITAQKEWDLALDTERRLFNEVLNQLPAAVAIVDPSTGQITFANHMLSEIWRLAPPKEMGTDLSNTFVGFFANGQQVKTKEWPIIRALSGERIQGEVIWIRRGDGTTGITRQWAAPVYGGDGSIMASVVAFLDVTEEKEAEQELQRTKSELETKSSMLETILQQMPLAVIVVDVSGRVVLANPQVEEVWRHKVSASISALALSDLTAFHRDGRRYESHEWPISRALFNGEIVKNEDTPVLLADGTPATVRLTAAPVRDQRGTVVAAIALSEDVTERVGFEARLQAERDTLATIFEYSPAAMAVWAGEDLVFERANPEYQKGFPGRQLIGKPLLEACPEFRDQPFPHLLRRVLTTGEPVVGHEQLARVQTEKDGPYRDYYYDFAYIRIMDHSGKPYGVYCHAVDVTTRVLSRIELEDARRSAELASLAKTNFLAHMSHEIRTPLGVISGTLQLLRECRTDAKEFERLNAMAERNATLLGKLIDDILDLSKVEAEELEIEETEFNLQDLLEDLTMILGVKAQEKGIRLLVNSDGPVPEKLYSDPLRLRQILTNVIGNGIKFTDKGEVTVTVRTLFPPDRRHKSEVEFTIKDTGIGLKPEQKENLFKPFSQADASITRRYGGTGLGLMISKRLAQMLSGDLEIVDCQENEGCTFRLVIQNGYMHESHFEQIARQEMKPEKPVEAGHVTNTPLSGQNLLLVDDSPDNLLIVSRFLRAAGARVVIAHDGEEALEKARKESFSAIIMDVQMPTMDGETATMHLRERGYERPVIALSAHAMRADRERGFKIGFSDYITKPVDRSLLIRKLADWAGPPM